MNSITGKLRKLRELRNYTQGYMANKLGMSQSNYGRIENGTVAIDNRRLEEIADVLGLTVDSILSFDETQVFGVHAGTENPAAVSLNRSFMHLNYQISPEIKKLYEDKIGLLEELYTSKIKLLEDRIKALEDQLQMLKTGN